MWTFLHEDSASSVLFSARCTLACRPLITLGAWLNLGTCVSFVTILLFHFLIVLKRSSFFFYFMPSWLTKGCFEEGNTKPVRDANTPAANNSPPSLSCSSRQSLESPQPPFPVNVWPHALIASQVICRTIGLCATVPQIGGRMLIIQRVC